MRSCIRCQLRQFPNTVNSTCHATRYARHRTKVESGGAIIIQKYVRGFLVRPRSEYVQELQSTRTAMKLTRNSHSAITGDLLELVEMVGLKPIPGLTLNSRKMMAMQAAEAEAKQHEKEELASVQIQAIFRARAGKKRMSIIAKKHQDLVKEMSATKIQAVARGFKARRRVKGIIQKEKEEAITRIQARIRLKRGRLESTQMKKRILREKVKCSESAASSVAAFNTTDSLVARSASPRLPSPSRSISAANCPGALIWPPQCSRGPASVSRRCTGQWRSSTWTTFPSTRRTRTPTMTSLNTTSSGEHLL